MNDSAGSASDLASRIEAARNRLAASHRVAVFSGAGLSAESGIATFRDPDADALWSRFDPTELASPDGFAANPNRVIDWYNWRRKKLASVTPNAAHLALAGQPQMIQITQNVDDLLERAGADPRRVWHLHGSILYDRCHDLGCDRRETVDMASPPSLRTCPDCNALLRPAVVWFGEALPQEVWQRAHDLCTGLDCLLVVGTSAQVYPAAGLVTLARQNGSQIIVIDPDSGAAGDSSDIHLAGPAGEILPALLNGLALNSPADSPWCASK